MKSESSKTKVLIVGAGPTGLVLALWLRRRNIPFRIIDKSHRPGETSRALAVQARTLEFYRQLGIAEDIIGDGVTVDQLTLYRRGRVVASAMLGEMGRDISRYAYLLFCSQDVHEGRLTKTLSGLGVSVERESELLEFLQNDSQVTAKIRTPKGDEVIEAEYLVGCDGAHSTVRHGLGIGFPGGTYAQVFFVADVQAKGVMAQKDRIQISVSAKDFCIVMPIKTKGSIRLTGLVPPEFEGKEKITFADVATSVQRNTGLDVEKVNWFSYYHVHHRVADHFRKGRVFLAGDAGHIHSPAGGQGMNTGIGDAINLAWKLADVIAGRASEKILDTYEVERMAFARVLVQTTDTAFKFIASRSYVGSLFRALVLPRFFATMTHFKPFVKFAFYTISQVRIKYRQSDLSQGELSSHKDTATLPGDRLPWVRFENGDNHESLSLLDWQLHIYGAARPNLEKDLNLKLRTYPWNADAESKGLIQNAAYLLRPDGHIAVISEAQNVGYLKGYLASL